MTPASSPPPMLSVTGLRKQFHRHAPVALDGVSFEVKDGEIFGLLGHNGAGKSTALGILLGMVYPDAGEVTIDGCSVQREREQALRQVGAIFESPAFYDYLTGWQNLKVLTAFSGGVEPSAMREVVEWVGLSKRVHHRVGTYSHGMRQRLALAQALLPRPKVLILDEPTDGLDPNQKHEVRNLIKRMGETKAIIFSTHILEEVEASCTRAIIIDRGKVIADGTPEQLKAKAENAGAVYLEATGLASSGIRQELEKLSEVKSVTVLESGENGITARILPNKGKGNALPEAVFKLAVAKGLTVHELKVEEGRLDELFREITRRDTED
ncbi:MAG: ABC transporter ATP-binding protein [Verrucomicrobiae bacterium]|nr:ABC transporter ATP-binding protein [Verrucomicrobiae bacterium]